jgi:PAS domain-containing protein
MTLLRRRSSRAHPRALRARLLCVAVAACWEAAGGAGGRALPDVHNNLFLALSAASAHRSRAPARCLRRRGELGGVLSARSATPWASEESRRAPRARRPRARPLGRFDRDLRERYVNPAVSRLAGIPAEQIFGRRCGELGLGAVASSCERRSAGLRDRRAPEHRAEFVGRTRARADLGARWRRSAAGRRRRSPCSRSARRHQAQELEAATGAARSTAPGYARRQPRHLVVEPEERHPGVGANWRWLFGVLEKTEVTFETGARRCTETGRCSPRSRPR